MIREWLTACVLAGFARGGNLIGFTGIQLRMDGADVFIYGFCKEIQLLRIERFAAPTEAYPLQMSQLQ